MVLYGTVWYCMVLHCVVEYDQHSASAGNVVSHGTVWYCVVLCGTVWYCVILYGTVWYCVVLCGTVWYCTVLLSTISSVRVPVRPHVLITEIQTVPSA